VIAKTNTRRVTETTEEQVIAMNSKIILYMLRPIPEFEQIPDLYGYPKPEFLDWDS
jgi:hypothetical protein